MARTLARLLLAAACLGGLSFATVQAAPPVGPESANIPRERTPRRAEWEIVFPEEISPAEYAGQLEYFGIEIAAVSKDGKVEYVSKLTQRRPEKREGTAEADPRLHIGWKTGTLFVTDRRILARARIATTNKKLVHYFPAEVQAMMAEREQEYADLEPSEIRRTRFAIRPKPRAAGYEFVVVEQEPAVAGRPASATGESRNKPAAP